MNELIEREVSVRSKRQCVLLHGCGMILIPNQPVLGARFGLNSALGGG
jgi:hypothetical protein